MIIFSKSSKPEKILDKPDQFKGSASQSPSIKPGLDCLNSSINSLALEGRCKYSNINLGSLIKSISSGLLSFSSKKPARTGTTEESSTNSKALSLLRITEPKTFKTLESIDSIVKVITRPLFYILEALLQQLYF